MTSSRPSSSEESTGFHRLAEPVRRWIWHKGWSSLRDIQEQAITALLDGDRDVIITAATAGGKTEAAFLPLISFVLENAGAGGFELVYVGPLRALINDQFERLEDLCERAELPVFPWHGDISQGVKTRARKNPRGVLLITPESLEALFVLRGLEIPSLFAGTHAIVIDELHALLDNERGVHLRSLLTRLELAVGRRIRRVGLSATLGQMTLAREYLRPEAPDSVVLLNSKSDGQELKVQLRGYREEGDPSRSQEEREDESSARRAVAEHLFSRLRGSRNLIFAGSRQSVEWYADKLRVMSEDARLPAEFFPHHASLSREHRIDLEKRLNSGLYVNSGTGCRYRRYSLCRTDRRAILRRVTPTTTWSVGTAGGPSCRVAHVRDRAFEDASSDNSGLYVNSGTGCRYRRYSLCRTDRRAILRRVTPTTTWSVGTAGGPSCRVAHVRDRDSAPRGLSSAGPHAPGPRPFDRNGRTID